jgi:LemA protein
MKITRRTLMQMVVVAVAALPLGGCSYNTFVSQEQTIQGAWAQVENQLQRRNDLIPNLVETTKGFAQHEEGGLQGHRGRASRLLAAKSPRKQSQRRISRRRRSAGCSPSSKAIRTSSRTNSSIG